MSAHDLPPVRRSAEGGPLPDCACPACGERHNAAASMGDCEGGKRDLRPEPGDLSVCWLCAAFLQFNNDFTLRLMTPDEVAALDDGTRMHLLRMRKLVNEVRRFDGH